MTPARVIGAGLSGLAAAWHLAGRGFAVTVSDRASRPGGLIWTFDTPHGVVETAANAFVWNPVVQQWFARLDITPVFPLEMSARRYIFRNGRPRRWPLTIRESLAMAGRLAATAVTRSFAARADESVAQWGNRAVGAAAREWLLEPAMQGIYAAPASELSAAAIFGGRARGRRRLVAPPRGMGEFIERLFKRLVDRGVRFEFNCDVDAIQPDRPTVVATDAASASRLIAPYAPRLSQLMAGVTLAPLTTATMFFTPRPDDVRGFGVLFPHASGVSALGVLINTDIFGGRSPVRSETWIVGERGRGLASQSDEQLRRMLAEDRQTLTGRKQDPIAMHITRWPNAIPVYGPLILAIARERPSLPPWLALAGNYLGTIGVAALLAVAEAAAARVADNAKPC